VVGAHIVIRRKFVPREYQNLARNFLLDVPRSALWAKPGMGKTSTVLSALDILQMAGSTFFPALVIAPKKVCEMVWPKECAQWDAFSNLKCVPLIGSQRVREEQLLRRADIYAINYDNIPWLVERLGGKWPYRIVIADESTKLKNFRLKGQGGKRAGALEKVAKMTGRWMNLTGTPVSNGLKDL
jgi:SNF2 family DNA or RNA helicase